MNKNLLHRYFKSKALIRLFVCALACFSVSEAQANFYFKVRLQNKETKEIKKFTVGGNADSEWSDWIYADLEYKFPVEVGQDAPVNGLRVLVGYKRTKYEQDKESDGRLKFTYKKGNETINISLSNADLQTLKNNGKYIRNRYYYTDSGQEYMLNPVCHVIYNTTNDPTGCGRVGVIGDYVTDMSGNKVTLEYDNAGGNMLLSMVKILPQTTPTNGKS